MFWSYIYMVFGYALCMRLANLGLPSKEVCGTARQSREQKLKLSQSTSRIGRFPVLCLQKKYIIPYKYWATLCNFRATKNQGDSRGQTDGTVSFLKSFSTGWLYCWFSDSRKKRAGKSFELFHGVQKSILFALKLVKWEKILVQKKKKKRSH